MTAVSIKSRSINNKIKTISLPQLNWNMVYILGILLCFSLFLFYIINVNHLTGGAYLIKDYNKKISNLAKENRNMEANFAETGLLEEIHYKVNELGFERISKINYVEILNVSLARVD